MKLGRGGLVEVEFIAQALQLAHARTNPGILATTTRVALAQLAKAGVLQADEAEALIAAERLWRTISGLLRLTVGRWRQDHLPDSVVAPLLHACRRLDPAGAPVDLAGLQAMMAGRSMQVRAVFKRHLGRPVVQGERE